MNGSVIESGASKEALDASAEAAIILWDKSNAKNSFVAEIAAAENVRATTSAALEAALRQK